ncbi:bifunctional diaminohydroxyphosphoribosylaminopyrimidine deaminase/5-amino-6-(5-phosphoribosylamino)uracil reductase RibD [Beijerinckia mobilis]|uniref:bifunctional diaminohydroxyphosphoribosylaminopyrimidine deaminase/5-amino-6-(5-phosphoribosylamino)uracil reductase RibD n=1 Tax=Beijerinckia mobilis TaxID=231434 RepID=UPI000554C59D|nr:bifunctional diaminohydroxyphosphoribosylaminopyrimidine deaminase/5-amino-6-(5-phosphoribosylamino)uracil reductase RibD [Beijerinckia mobilis]
MSIEAIASSVSEADVLYMEEALALGRRGLGRSAPNPSVGALLVKNGVVVGKGRTQPGGRPHAETDALAEAGESARGATLYVTLEPCSHFGVTPPCAAAIIAAGVARVVCALEDPDPRVSGRGYRMLRDAGIEVVHGVLEAEARRANLGHILRTLENRPMVTLKLAMTQDGYAGKAHGTTSPAQRLKITGPEADEEVHRMRASHDAIMIGVGTAIADDPLLTVRLPGMETIKPLRIVLDSHLRLPLDSRLVRTAVDHPTLVFTRADAPAEAIDRLRAASVAVETVESVDAAETSLDLSAALHCAAGLGLTRVFSEGGPRVADALIGLGVADDIILLTSDRTLGGAQEQGADIPGLSSSARALITQSGRYHLTETRMLGKDRLTHYERIL